MRATHPQGPSPLDDALPVGDRDRRPDRRSAVRRGGHARVAVTVAMALVAALLVATPTFAFPMTGCSLTLESFDRDGRQLDTAVGDEDDGDGGTLEDPLIVDYEGTVRYRGSTGDAVIRDASWTFEIFRVPTFFRGSIANEAGESTLEGEIDLRAVVPFRPGLLHLSGELSGEGGACRASGWIRTEATATEAITTLPFWIGAIVTLIGLLILWLARPRRRVEPRTVIVEREVVP